MAMLQRKLQQIAAEVPQSRAEIVPLLRKAASCSCEDDMVAELDEMYARQSRLAKVRGKRAHMNLNEQLHRLADKFMADVSEKVALQLGWKVRQGGGIGHYTLTGGPGQGIDLALNLDSVPFMVDVRGAGRPFKVFAYTTESTSGLILRKLAAQGAERLRSVLAKK